VLISSGMSGLGDVIRAVDVFRASGSPFLVLQCTSAYPCPPELVNLRAMVAMGEELGCLYGLSDHTTGIWTSIAAVSLGASAVEKHFTLSKRSYGPDHHASLEPDELRCLVEGIREVEQALGSGLKERDPSYDQVRATFEKSVVSVTSIPAGTVIESSMLATKRPGTGIPAVRVGSLVGRRARRDIEANTLIEETDLD
jgi:N,N'-diacetyllegionaminate synthase